MEEFVHFLPFVSFAHTVKVKWLQKADFRGTEELRLASTSGDGPAQPLLPQVESPIAGQCPVRVSISPRNGDFPTSLGHLCHCVATLMVFDL